MRRPHANIVIALLGAIAMAASCDSGRSPTAPSSPPPQTQTAALTGLTLGSSSVAGGGTVTGTVTVSTAAPAGGFAVTLASDDPEAMTVPASVTVAAAATSGTFTIVAGSDVAFATTITITATAGDVTRTATLRVTPAAGAGPIASVAAAHDDVIGGDDTTATVTLTAPAPAGGAGFTLQSDDDHAGVPDALVIPAGETSATFAIETAPVTSAIEAHITITAGVGLVPRRARRQARDVAAAFASVTLTLTVIPRPNTAPTIASIADRTIDEDTNTGALAVTVDDAETGPGSLSIAGGSSNTTLVPIANIVFGGSGANRTITVTPAADRFGTATITVTASDGVATATQAFVVTVAQVFDDQSVFNYNGTDGSDGSPQDFIVPDGVERIEIDASGAEGTAGSNPPDPLLPIAGGLGGRVTATIGVTAGETLHVFVGGQAAISPQVSVTGFNGGGASSTDAGLGGAGGAGGGASDVRRAPYGVGERLVVAGGGGGGGGRAGPPTGTGGAGGGTIAASGADAMPGVLLGGGGGTQSAGGDVQAIPAGIAGTAGGVGSGGSGGNGEFDNGTFDPGAGGGGGGGGFYGGGGGIGGFGFSGSGGGGGSSYVDATVVAPGTTVAHEPGVRGGHGVVIIRW